MAKKAASILLVEDNVKILEANTRVFTGEGYTVFTAESLARARELLVEAQPDAIVLDIMLPDGSGLDFIEEIRQVSTAPVLLLTALNEKDDRLHGLKAGGDDYISKPYDIDELAARVEAAIRRDRMLGGAPAKTLELGPLALDMLSDQALLHGNDMLLTQKEFLLLLLLAQNEGRVMPAEELYKRVWGQPMLKDDHAIKNAVYRLRKKLSGSGFIISGLRGSGYRFEREE